MTKYAKPNDDLNINPFAYNHLLDLYSQKIGKGVTSRSLPPAGRDTRIVCQNNTPVDLLQFSIVGFGSPVVDPSDDETGFLENYCIQTAPTQTNDPYKWGVLQESIPRGEFGELLISGITAVKIMPGSIPLPYAIPSGSFDWLIGSTCGICRVIWMAGGEDPATDFDSIFPPDSEDDPLTGPVPQWALVNIG